MTEILETNPDGSPSLTRTKIVITNSLIHDPKVLSYVGQEAWVYTQGVLIWVVTNDNTNLILLPYISDEKPGEYKIV